MKIIQVEYRHVRDVRGTLDAILQAWQKGVYTQRQEKQFELLEKRLERQLKKLGYERS